MSDKDPIHIESQKMKWLLSLVRDICNKTWAEHKKNLCTKCREEKEFEALGWNDLPKRND